MTTDPVLSTATLPDPEQVSLSEGRILLRCQVPKCYYACTYGSGSDSARASFQRHLSQHEPGRAPDLRSMRVSIEATCSNCGNYISIDYYEDGDRIWCIECSASWDQYGSNGRTDLEPPDDY